MRPAALAAWLDSAAFVEPRGDGAFKLCSQYGELCRLLGKLLPMAGSAEDYCGEVKRVFVARLRELQEGTGAFSGPADAAVRRGQADLRAARAALRSAEAARAREVRTGERAARRAGQAPGDVCASRAANKLVNEAEAAVRAAEEAAVAAVRLAVEDFENLKRETSLSLNDAVRRLVEFQVERARSCASFAQRGVFETCNSFAVGSSGANCRTGGGGLTRGASGPLRRKGAIGAWLGAKARYKRGRAYVKKVAALPVARRAFSARQAKQTLREVTLRHTLLRATPAEIAAPEVVVTLEELRRHRRAARELVGALRQWSSKARTLYAPDQRAYGNALRHLPSPLVDAFLALEQAVHREELRLSDRLHGVAEGLQAVLEGLIEPAIVECRELLQEVAHLDKAKADVEATRAQLAAAPEARELGLKARLARQEALASQRYDQALARMLHLVGLTRSPGAGVPNGAAASWQLPPLAHLRRGGDRIGADIARHLGRAVTACASCNEEVLGALQPWLEASTDPYAFVGTPASPNSAAPRGAFPSSPPMSVTPSPGLLREGADASSRSAAATKVPPLPNFLASQDSYVVQRPGAEEDSAEESYSDSEQNEKKVRGETGNVGVQVVQQRRGLEKAAVGEGHSSKSSGEEVVDSPERISSPVEFQAEAEISNPSSPSNSPGRQEHMEAAKSVPETPTKRTTEAHESSKSQPLTSVNGKTLPAETESVSSIHEAPATAFSSPKPEKIAGPKDENDVQIQVRAPEVNPILRQVVSAFSPVRSPVKVHEEGRDPATPASDHYKSRWGSIRSVIGSPISDLNDETSMSGPSETSSDDLQ